MSEKIITVSEVTKLSILKHFPKANQKKIEVVYEGVITLQSPQPLQSPQSLLYVGNSYPHKNLKTLLDAFKIFSEKNPEAKLIMAGHKDLFSEAIENYAREQKIERVEFFRDIDDTKLAELYAGAKLYIFPSRLEGFGLPALEAMSVKVPVIAARAGSLPEVLGEAAEYFDPDNTTELVGLMEKLWHNETRQNELITKGLEQIKKYSWKKMAEEIKEIYSQIPSTPSSPSAP